jgi:hypothetical protein
MGSPLVILNHHVTFYVHGIFHIPYPFSPSNFDVSNVYQKHDEHVMSLNEPSPSLEVNLPTIPSMPRIKKQKYDATKKIQDF